MCWFCLVLIPIVYNLLSIEAAIDGLLTVYWKSKNLEVNWKRLQRWTGRQYQTQWLTSNRSALLPRHTNPTRGTPDSRPPGLKMNPWEESYHKANQLNARWRDGITLYGFLRTWAWISLYVLSTEHSGCCAGPITVSEEPLTLGKEGAELCSSLDSFLGTPDSAGTIHLSANRKEGLS